MIKKIAYRIVLKDMEQSPIFNGTLKADPQYLRGIDTVKEHISRNAGKKFKNKFLTSRSHNAII